MAGEYTLTIVADSGCAAALPADVRSRTYAATMREAAPNPHNPPNTIFTTSLSGASFVEGYDTLHVGVAGDLATFAFSGHGPHGLVEQLAPNTYLGLDGWVHAPLGPAVPPTISVAFEGSLTTASSNRDLVNPTSVFPATVSPTRAVKQEIIN